MKVLHLLSSTGFHGAETMATELIRHSSALGIECHLGVFDNDGRGDRRALEVATGHLARGWIVPARGRLDWAAVRAISGYVREHDVNIVHSHKYKTTLHALLARAFARFKLVTTYHNWLMESRSLALYAALDKRLARFCDAAIGVSTVVAAELARFVPEARVSYIGNGVDTEKFTSRLTKESARAALGLGSRPVIGFVGRLSRQKGIDDLVEALESLRGSVDADLLIVGDGDHRRQLEEHVRSAGLSERTHFLGTRSDTPALYRAMDLFVLPSYEEAFPMVALEAMACELPVIATDVGDVARIVSQGETGWIVKPGAPAQLAAAIAETLGDRATRERMGLNGRATVVREHSASRMAEKYAERYRSVCSPA